MTVKNNAPQGPERFLFKSAGIVLWGYTLMLFIMLLPPIALKMNPGAEMPGVESLKTQSLIAFSPLFMTLAGIVTAMFFAVVQNKYFVASALAEGKDPGPNPLKRLLIPVWRYREIYLLAGEKPLIKPMLVCSVLYWISIFAFGMLSPFPFYFQLAAILLFYASVKRSTGRRLGRFMRAWSFILLIGFLMSGIDGFRALTSPGEKLDTFIPSSRQEWQKELLSGKENLYDFAPLARDYIFQKHVCSKLNDARFHYAVPEKFRKMTAETLAHPQTVKTFSVLEQALDDGKFLYYDFLSSPYHWYQPGYSQFKPVIGRYFGAKILQALEKGDRVEVMKNFRRLSAFGDCVQRGDFSFSLITTFYQELNRAFLIGAMLGRNILTDQDLQEIASFNAGREEKLLASLPAALRGEALLERELINDMMKLYPWIQSSESTDGNLFSSAVLKFLLRGNNAFPPNTWNKVVHKQILDESAKKFDLMLSRFDKKSQFPKEDKKFSGSYFVILNYKAQQNAAECIYHAATFVRMTDLALKIEKFRRAHNRLPATLKELNTPIPLDAYSGKKISFKAPAFEITTYPAPAKTGRMSVQGWQLHGSIKDYINVNVPTSWPLPAPKAE